MTGMIQGGWGYVVAAYGISWVVLLAYIGLLYARGREGGAP